MPKLAAAPVLLQESLLFPYLSGAEFLRQFKVQGLPAWPFDSLPESSAQIMHPAKYFGHRVPPLHIALPPLDGGAERLTENTLGEFETRIFVYEQSHDLNLAARAAAGWAGDRYVLASLGDGRDALAWALAWDTPVDAGEFMDALDFALPIRYPGIKRIAGSADHRQFEGGGRTVEVTAVTVDGHPVVLYSDVPAGVDPHLIDAARIRVSR